jgi:muramidase (phage lysozyme)
VVYLFERKRMGSLRNLLAGIGACFLLASCGASPAVQDDQGEIASGGHWIVIGNVNTVLKKRIDEAKDLALGTEKCTLSANAKYPIQAAGKDAGESHILINLQKMIPGCGFSQGYVYKGHIAKNSFSLQGTAKARERALLDVIAYAEGTDNRYDVTFGHHTFSSFAWHPQITYCDGLCSNAAGRYQFLDTTWEMASRELGLGSFSPANQDKAALYLIHSRGVGDIAAIDTFEEFSRAIDLMGWEWASLPNSPYGQVRTTKQEIWNVFQSAVKKYSS